MGVRNLAPLQYTSNVVWGDARAIWGDSSYVWNFQGVLDQWRRFPAKTLRSDLAQIAFAPGSFVVYRSDDYPEGSLATVDNGAKTATIATPSGYTSILWPLDVVDMSISFESDDYANLYPITALDVTNKIVTFSDAGNLSTNGSLKWQISGIKKEQRVSISDFVVHFSYLGQLGSAYGGPASSTGDNENG